MNYYDREKDDNSFAKIWEAVKAHANKWGDTLFVIDEAHIHFSKNLCQLHKKKCYMKIDTLERALF